MSCVYRILRNKIGVSVGGRRYSRWRRVDIRVVIIVVIPRLRLRRGIQIESLTFWLDI